MVKNGPTSLGGLKITIKTEQEIYEVYYGPNRIINAGRRVYSENVTVQWYFPKPRLPLQLTPAMVIGAWYQITVFRQPTDENVFRHEFDMLIKKEEP